MNYKICTIGFSKKSLRYFISLLQKANVTKLVDTRLNNTSQLAGFAKKQDLEYLLELVEIKYTHQPELAPTQDILKLYKNKDISWQEYEKQYLQLLEDRQIMNMVKEAIGNEIVCFLCSEHKAEHCHRRLLVEYIQEKDSGNEYNIKHLT